MPCARAAERRGLARWMGEEGGGWQGASLGLDSVTRRRKVAADGRGAVTRPYPPLPLPLPRGQTHGQGRDRGGALA